MTSKYTTSNFQRSQSKVWWSDFDTIQEKRTTTFAYSRHGSPSSHKSQDSGFSDTELSPPLKTVTETTPKKISPVLETEFDQRSPASASSVEATPATPPTVIRKQNSNKNSDKTRENFTSRRISFSAPSSPHNDKTDAEKTFIEQIDSLNYSPVTPPHYHAFYNHSSHELNSQNILHTDTRTVVLEEEDEKETEDEDLHINNSLTSSRTSSTSSSKCDRDRSIKRGRVISRSSSKYNRSLSLKFSSHDEDNLQNKNAMSKPDEINNNSLCLNSELMHSFEDAEDLPIRTSTPKPYELDKEFPPKCVQHWLSELRMSTHHEVLSTLQTKSIAAEAGRNLKVTSAIAAKVIRNTQTQVMVLQNDFERIEKLVNTTLEPVDENEIATNLHVLANSLIEFMDKQKTRMAIYCENEADLRKFDENIRNICDISMDLRIVATKLNDYDLESIRENVLILKRYALITIRLMFDKLVKIIVDSIEDTKCHLILRSNLSTLSMMSNIEYSGFASLNAAFIANGTIRVLLLHIIESKHSSIRALALRALATVCSSQESIRQFEQAGGIEILREIMADSSELRCEPELRETVSVLTQLTAPWHGDEHSVAGLKDCIESFVGVITEILSTTRCCQTLLLCAACLNNFTRLEPTSIYSIMSHGTIKKLQIAVEDRGPGSSIFLAEQVTSMLLNMASNKKCHNHLGEKHVISFITKIFKQKFYDHYNSRSESDSHKKTIKNILYIISRLIHEAIINPEILEQDVLPIFMKIENTLTQHSEVGSSSSRTANGLMYSKDITFLNKKLNESLTYKHNHSNMNKNNSPLSTMKKRQESFV